MELGAEPVFVGDKGVTEARGLRLRYVGSYALEETGREKSAPFWTPNLKLGYRIEPKVQLCPRSQPV